MKAKFITLLGFVLVATIILPVDVVQAENDGGEYQSNSSIGFHGEYVFPEGVKPPIVVPSPDPEGNHTLPQTGVRQSRLSELGGFTLIGYYLLKKLKIKKGE